MSTTVRTEQRQVGRLGSPGERRVELREVRVRVAAGRAEEADPRSSRSAAARANDRTWSSSSVSSVSIEKPPPPIATINRGSVIG